MNIRTPQKTCLAGKSTKVQSLAFQRWPLSLRAFSVQLRLWQQKSNHPGTKL